LYIDIETIENSLFLLEHPQLVVLGQFKRGKTTFINALIGINLLPTAVIPLTSVVTILKYGDKPKAFVKFLSGKRSEVTISELKNYTTEGKNPKNIKQVDKVTIEYPPSILKRWCSNN